MKTLNKNYKSVVNIICNLDIPILLRIETTSNTYP